VQAVTFFGNDSANLLGMATLANATITPLRFLPIDPSSLRRRGPAAHKRRRRLTPAGLELEGNLNTLGYFSAEVCTGSPPRSFDLIVDTGSALTAFPVRAVTEQPSPRLAHCARCDRAADSAPIAHIAASTSTPHRPASGSIQRRLRRHSRCSARTRHPACVATRAMPARAATA